MSGLLSSTLGPPVKLVIETEEGLPPAIADRNQLEMALLNLAVNAGDAMPSGGMLRLTVDKQTLGSLEHGLVQGTYVHLTVSDTGTGMDAETLGRAIEPFFSTRGLGRGSGLGLSMVHGLASQLGGALVLESSVGNGTTAQLFLPAGTNTIADRAHTPAEPRSPATGRVLLVDDEDAVRSAAGQMLQDLGYEVVEANCADAALQLVKEGVKPDFLVSDHLMPGMTGTELARTLRSVMPTVGVLIVSGYAEVETLSPDLAHLPKPFRQQDLAMALAGEKVFGVITVEIIKS